MARLLHPFRAERCRMKAARTYQSAREARLERELVLLRAELRRVKARLAELEQAALADPLTGIGNRRALERRIGEELSRSRRTGRPFCLLAIDVDFFKLVNDTYGHAAGDAVLVKTAQTLSSVLREGDYIARYGGEEFVVILPETDEETGLGVAERIRRAVECAVCSLDGERISITVSVGLACFPKDGATPGSLFGAADRALYKVKEAGRNGVMPAGEVVP